VILGPLGLRLFQWKQTHDASIRGDVICEPHRLKRPGEIGRSLLEWSWKLLATQVDLPFGGVTFNSRAGAGK
jgi:hypothetical protein